MYNQSPASIIEEKCTTKKLANIWPVTSRILITIHIYSLLDFFVTSLYRHVKVLPYFISHISHPIMRWAAHVAHMGEERGVYRVLVGKPEGRRPLVRPRRRWVDNIRMDLQEVGCGYMDWTGLAQDRDRWRTLVSAVMNLRVQWNVGNFLTSCKPVSFSRRTLNHGVSKSSCSYRPAVCYQTPCIYLISFFLLVCIKKVNQSHCRPEVPRGFREVKVPRFHDNGTGW